MNWQIMILVAIATAGMASLYQKAAMKEERVSSIAYASFFQILAAAILLIAAMIKGLDHSGLWKVWPNLLLGTALYTGANLMWFKALNLSDVSNLVVILTTRVIWVVLGAFLFLKESLSPYQLVGAILILIGVVIVSLKKSRISFDKGGLYVLGSAACYGFAFVNDSYILRTSDVLTYNYFAFLLSGLLIWIIFPSITKEITKFITKEYFPKVTAAAFLYATAMTTLFYAYQLGRNAAQITPLYQVSAVVTVVLAAIIFKEKDNLPIKVAAVLISIIGVYLINL